MTWATTDRHGGSGTAVGRRGSATRSRSRLDRAGPRPAAVGRPQRRPAARPGRRREPSGDRGRRPRRCLHRPHPPFLPAAPVSSPPAAGRNGGCGWAWSSSSAGHRCPAAPGGTPMRSPRRWLGRRTLTAAWERGVGPAPRTVDLVHAPTLLFPPRRWRPLVVTMHDTVPWTHPETLTARGVAWHRAAAARAAREADLVVVPTEAVATELAELLPLRARPLVVGEGVSAGLVVPPDADQ